MKKITTPLVLAAIFCLSFALTATAGAADCTTKRKYVEAKNGIPAHHEMISSKSGSITRAWGAISATCFYDREGNLTYDLLYRSYNCHSLLPLSENPKLVEIMRSVGHIGESCQKEWDAVDWHPLLK